ncbi:Uncharacterised protein [Mycobacteroides abscessus]|nr:Uncharacterised protein [Mycobacteroides abscessus]
MPFSGMTVISCSPLNSVAASRPFTEAVTVPKSEKSRLKRDRFWVAVALITMVPLTSVVSGSSRSVRSYWVTR